MSRRDLLRVGGAAVSALALLQACAPAPTAPATAAPTIAPTTAAAPTAASPTVAPVASPAPATAPSVATAPATAATAAVTAAAEGVPGGTLRITLGAEPQTMDPLKTTTIFSNTVRSALFDGLIDEDTLSGVRGALAESWDSADALSWTFKLRDGLTFHDGSPCTADAVKATFDRILDPTAGAVARLDVQREIDSVKVVDPKTVAFTLKAKDAAFPLFLSGLKIIPKDFNPDKPIGTGPFQFVEWVRNQHVRVKKFPNYFQKGLPYLDELSFLPTPDENQKVVLLQTGQVDFIDTIPLPKVKDVQQGGKLVVFSVPPGVAPSYYWMLVRNDKPPLNDKRVRQAINLAIDRKAQFDVTFDEGSIRSNMIPPKHWAFDPNARSYDNRDVAQAKQLLADAGQKGGFSLQLKHVTSRAEFASIAQLFQSSLADVGIKIEIVPLEIGVWTDQVRVKRDYDLGLTGVVPAEDPSLIFDEVDPDLPGGKALGWKNDDFVKAVAEGKATVDQNARKTSYFRAQEIVQDEVPGLVMNERPILVAATPAVQGFRPDIGQRAHFTTVWLKR